jgi:hypothetical protein
MSEKGTQAKRPSAAANVALATLTPRLIAQVARRVYALWRADLERERERARHYRGSRG